MSLDAALDVNLCVCLFALQTWTVAASLTVSGLSSTCPTSDTQTEESTSA